MNILKIDMKEIKWLIIVLMMALTLQVSGRVVSSPLFKSNSIECLYVESVELTDSATRLNVSFVNFPGRNAMSDTLNLSGYWVWRITLSAQK